jgi:hypothetical protein
MPSQKQGSLLLMARDCQLACELHIKTRRDGMMRMIYQLDALNTPDTSTINASTQLQAQEQAPSGWACI